jgi:hypothetical protein
LITERRKYRGMMLCYHLDWVWRGFKNCDRRRKKDSLCDKFSMLHYLIVYSQDQTRTVLNWEETHSMNSVGIAIHTNDTAQFLLFKVRPIFPQTRLLQYWENNPLPY